GFAHPQCPLPESHRCHRLVHKWQPTLVPDQSGIAAYLLRCSYEYFCWKTEKYSLRCFRCPGHSPDRKTPHSYGYQRETPLYSIDLGKMMRSWEPTIPADRRYYRAVRDRLPVLAAPCQTD